MTTVERVNANDLIEALKAEYGGFRMLHPKGVFEALMTGEQNGLLEEAGYELDENGELVIHYHAHQEGKDTINGYIK